MKASPFRVFILMACAVFLSEGFHAPLKAETAGPWPNSTALLEEYQNLKLQSELYMAMDPEVAGEIPEMAELERLMEAKLNQIHGHRQSLADSPEGQALLSLSRKIKIMKAVRDKLATCYQSRKGQAATRAVLEALAEQPEECVAFSSDSQLTSLLTALAAPATSATEHNKQQLDLMNDLFFNTVLQSAQRYGELTYLVQDLASDDLSFFDQLCGSEAWCQRLAETQGQVPHQNLKDLIDSRVKQQHDQMREQGLPRRSISAIGRSVQCELLGCGDRQGLYTKLNHNMAVELSGGAAPLSISLDLLEQQGGTHLNLAGLPLLALDAVAGSDPDAWAAQFQAEQTWSEGVESQAQLLIEEHIAPLEADPVLQVLSARTDIAAALCMGGCRAQVARSSTSGAMEISLVNSQNLSPLNDDFLIQLKHRPASALKGALESTKDLLTEGLSAIGRDLYRSDPLSPAEVQRNLGRLISGNPMATAQTLLTRPELISALCAAIESMEDDNPWIDVLVVAGGVGAVVVGGLVAGPVGLSIASAAVGLGSAAYGYDQYREHSAMARHYQVACFNEVDPLSSERCRSYHQESALAQMNLLGAGVDVITLGSFSTYRRMLTQAITTSTGLSRSLNHLRMLPTLLKEVSEVMDDSTARLLNQSLAASTAAEREEFLSLYQRAKTYLSQEDFHESLRMSVRKACGQGAVR